MRPRAHKPDYVLATAVTVLLGIGLMMIYSLSPILSNNLGTKDNYYFWRQLISFGAGLAAWIWASSVDYEKWRGRAKVLAVLAGLGLIALLIPGLGITRNGATRWLNLGITSFQPAELLKIAAVLYFAGWLEKNRGQIKSLKQGIMPFGLIMAAIAAVVVFYQRDLGSMGVIAAAGLGMYFIAGVRWSHLATLIGGGLALVIASTMAFSHRIARVTAFLNPGQDPTGVGYHINQALIAVGSGGLFGVGLGRSIQVYGYLPEASNDSIFAVIAEEFGLIGSLLVIGLLGVVVYRGFKIALRAPDMFSRLTAAGITLVIMFQSLINIAAMLSLVPLTGITLPFISFGGTSLVITMLAVGILYNISKYTAMEEAYARDRQRRGNGWSYIADPGYRRRPKIAR